VKIALYMGPTCVGGGVVALLGGTAALQVTDSAHAAEDRGDARRPEARQPGGAPTRSVSAPRRRKAKRPAHTVRPGESLWQLTEDRLSPATSMARIARETRRLYDYNVKAGRLPRGGDPDLIHPGAVLQFPALEADRRVRSARPKGKESAKRMSHAPSSAGNGPVSRIQRALGIRASGAFDQRTRKAVMAFQRRRGLLVDGIVGPQTRAALGLAPAPSAPAPPPAPPSSTAASPTQPATAPSGKLARIAQCESGGDPGAIGGGGAFRGKYQFTIPTWQSVGGTGDPAKASEAEQDKRAAILLARNGTRDWPVCGSR
jgi:hypothetical protein